MDLKDSLRRDRIQGKEKEPFPRSLFAHVGGLVRHHRLGEQFCEMINQMTATKIEDLVRSNQDTHKNLYEPPLFFLATPEEYRAIKEILAEADNPYLAWAASPEEIVLSGPLFTRCPELAPEALATRHFAALFFRSFEGGG